jgi:IMP dehydrogenase/GMP reductase
MTTLYELEDIVLLPTQINSGHPGDKIEFRVKDAADITGMAVSLPIFTAPMESIVRGINVETFARQGIKPVLPGSESVDVRMKWCEYVFCAFSLQEVHNIFLQHPLQSQNQFHICIDAGNGHDKEIFSTAQVLRRTYGNQVLLMGGNVGLPEVYKDYSMAGFDYMRVGIASSSLADEQKYGFHYPMASLLNDIKTFKTGGPGKGLKPVKIIADGGIASHSDIIKALACGADYVMIGRQFAHTVEAAGEIYKRESGQPEIQINLGSIQGWNRERLIAEGLSLYRPYSGNTTGEIRAKRRGFGSVSEWEASQTGILISDTSDKPNWILVDYSLEEWIDGFKECTYYAFMMTGSLNWSEFKKNIRYGIT